MATTLAGSQLTQLHRQRQLGLRAASLRDLLTLWPMFDIEDIDGTWPPLESALLTLIFARHRDSAVLAANYYRAFRLTEGATGTVEPRLADPPNRLLTTATLRLLGPIQAKKNIAARRPRVAETTLTRLTGTVGRQILEGGRKTVTESVKADPQAKGMRRVTSSSPCDFCADLASKDITGADVDFAAHDHCGCSQEPAF